MSKRELGAERNEFPRGAGLAHCQTQVDAADFPREPTSMIADSSHVQAEPIRTDFVTFPNRAGLKLAACLDHAGDLRGRPWVVVAPKYGETKKNNLQTAYYLAANGVNVLRFDMSNHVGESAGRMPMFTIPGAVHDIVGAFDYLEHDLGITQAGLLANSLSARMAVRATALDPRVRYLISLVGVVNVQRTLTVAYQEDVVANFIAGKRWGVSDVLGFDIDFENFLGALVDSGMHTLEGTGEDLARTTVPVAFLSAQKDAWVELDEVRAVAERAPRGEFRVIKDAMHEVRENPEAAERTFRELVALCLSWARGAPTAPDSIVIPDKKLYLRQNKIERDRFRKANPDPTTEVDFWSKYLGKYGYFEQVDVYQYYVALVGDLLGPFRPADVVLDAGCGNGLFGVWALRHLLDRHGAPLDPPPFYLGLDLTHKGLIDALNKHDRIRGDLVEAAPARATRMGLGYVQMDLDQFGGIRAAEEGLVDFAPGTFDKICCSLVISYLRRPHDLLRELHRVLKPGGRIVVTSMKPFADLSDLYRRYAEKHTTEYEIESARDLLRAAGKIKVKEEQGYYTFFSGEELSDAMHAIGFRNAKATMSFGNQATVVSAEK
jgi:SAM-dependent methyltransferase/pimeloyl-ACP methyl ester carboxylesterase